MQANPAFKPVNVPSGAQAPKSGYQASVPVTVYRELAAELQSTQAKLSFFQLQNEQLTRQNQMLLQEFEAIAQSTDRIQAILTQSNLPDAKLSEVLNNIRSASPSHAAPAKANPQTNNPNPQTQGRPPATTKGNPSPQVSPRKANVLQTTNAIQDAISRARQLATDGSPQVPVTQVPVTQAPVTQAPSGGEPLYYDSSYATFDAPAPRSVTPTKAKMPAKLQMREEISSRPLRTDSEESPESTGLSGWVLTLTIAAIILTSFGAGYLLMRPFVK